MMKITLFCVTILLIILNTTDGAVSKKYKRQAETALAAPSSSSAMVTLTNLILPTVRALIQAPVKMVQELIQEIRVFLSTHNFSEMFDTTFIRSLIQRLPERAGRYWLSFLELESECIQRTLCDVADFTTHQVPQWVKQILLVYFTTFNENIYFEAINNGLIAHNCQAKFSQCDPNSFLSKISNNVSNSIHTTVAPIKEALDDLVNVTMSTLAVNDEPAVTPSLERLQSDDDFGDDISGAIEDRQKQVEISTQLPKPTPPAMGFINIEPQQQPPVVLNQNSFTDVPPAPQFQPMPIQPMVPAMQPFPPSVPMMMMPPHRQMRNPESEKVQFSS